MTTATISDETQALIDIAEPAKFEEEPFQLTPGAAEPEPEKKKGGRPKGKTKKTIAREKRQAAKRDRERYPDGQYRPGQEPRQAPAHDPQPTPEEAAAAARPIDVEPPKPLVRSTRWILRNAVVLMKDAYGWDEPEDYEEWLQECSFYGAKAVQKYFPDWMDRFGDEILLLAILLIWITPNVSKQLRKRKELHHRPAGPEGERKDNSAVPFAVAAAV